MSAKGIYLCLITMASWAFLLVVSKSLMLTISLDPWIFTIIQLLFGGVFLIAISGKQTATLDALKSLYTWAYGAMYVLGSAGFTASLVYVSAANASFFAVISIPLATLVFLLLFSRIPSASELPGHIAIVCGLMLLVSSVEGTYTNPAIYLILFSEFAVVCKVILAEFHPQNQGDDLKERASLSGVMLLASALVMLITLAALSLITGATEAPTAQQEVANWKSSLPVIDLAQIWSPTMWVAAAAVGIFIRGAAMFLSMQAINVVGGQNYLATVAMLPFASMLFEFIADKAGYLPQALPEPRAVLAGIIATIGTLVVVWIRQRQLKTETAFS